MEFTPASLPGAYIVRLRRIEDDRGYFARGWCREEFRQQGLNSEMTQLNVAMSLNKGTLRGMHFQVAPHAEAKFVRCTRGAIYDVIVDVRADSATRGQWFGVELTEANDTMLYVPEGFAHGYQTLVDNTDMFYMTSAAYAPQHARGVRFDDPVFGIEWPLPVSIMSTADRAWPDYQP